MRRGSLWIALVVLCVMGNAACGGSSHHVTPPITTNNFVFYAAGEEASGDTYSIVGVVSITTDGNNTITGGEQDFNDGDVTTSPQPLGDTILASGSSLVMDPDGSGNAILTLATNNPNMGVLGTETFALAFANANHAIVSQFDGSAVSSGSYDLQKLPGGPLGATSFSLITSGVDPEGIEIDEGGVIALDGSGNVTGSVDINDGGHVSFANSPTEGTVLSTIDSFGRGSVSGSLDGSTAVVNFYVVNSEVLRLIDVDTTDTAVGSVYGQGAQPTTFSTASIGQSAFTISGVNNLEPYAGAGQFFSFNGAPDAQPRTKGRVHPQEVSTCTGGACFIDGIADVNESLLEGPTVLAQPFEATSQMAASGYGAFIFAGNGPTPDIVQFGVYAVDPTLNILDPNNPAGGSGGALIAEMDANLVGTGLLIPQTDETLSDIAPNVVFNAQGNGVAGLDLDEFDLLGASSVAGTPAVTTPPLAAATAVFNGVGFIDDPFGILTGSVIGDANSTFGATFTDDGSGFGRSTSGAGGFTATSSTDSGATFTVTAYMANGGQFFWVETDSLQTFAGSIQSSTFTVPVASKAPAKPKNK
jgi:hypothetical protein